MHDFDDSDNPYAADYSNFLLAGTPRHVPIGVRLRIFLGGFLNQFGWFFLGFGSIFFWIFGAAADITSITHFSGQVNTTQGIISKSEETGFSEGGSEHSDGTPVYANHFTYSVDGTEYEGVSYATGRKLGVGSTQRIEYPSGSPDVGRIEGMRCNIFSVFVLFVCIFPLIGLIMILSGVKKSFRGNYLLANGRETKGSLIKTERTGTQINNQTVMKYTFSFLAEDNQEYEVVAKSHTNELTDEAEERILYDEYDPSFAVVMDSLPGGPRINENGEITNGAPGATLIILIVPILTMLGNTYAFMYFAGL